MHDFELVKSPKADAFESRSRLLSQLGFSSNSAQFSNRMCSRPDLHRMISDVSAGSSPDSSPLLRSLALRQTNPESYPVAAKNSIKSLFENKLTRHNTIELNPSKMIKDLAESKPPNLYGSFQQAQELVSTMESAKGLMSMFTDLWQEDKSGGTNQ